MASCSSGLKCNVQKLGRGFSVFEAFGNHAEGEGLHARNGFITVGAIAHDPRQRRPDISVAQERLGWTPKVSLEEGLRRTIPYFEQLLATLPPGLMVHEV